MQQFQKTRIWKHLNRIQFGASGINTNWQTSKPLWHQTNKPVKQYSTALNVPCKIPPSQLESKTHPLGWEKIQAQVEPYFSKNWTFSSEKEKKGFLGIGFSRAFSHFFPLTLDDRIDATGKMLYLSLLIDDQLEKMSFTQMLCYRDRVVKIASGQLDPDRSVCHEWMLHDTITSMRDIDEALANDVAQGFCQLLQAQTSQERTSIKTFGAYLQFREIDVGRPLYTALIRFGAKLNLTAAELEKTIALESTAFRHISVMNDIYSWEREWKVYQVNPTDGAQPFSAIYILANETGLPFVACKRLLYSYCRELESVLKTSREEILRQGSLGRSNCELEVYTRGLEYFMRGLELWSQWTPRYRH